MSHIQRIVRFTTGRLLGRRPTVAPGVTRLTVIPRNYGLDLSREWWDGEVKFMLQDDGRTLKVWITRKETS